MESGSFSNHSLIIYGCREYRQKGQVNFVWNHSKQTIFHDKNDRTVDVSYQRKIFQS